MFKIIKEIFSLLSHQQRKEFYLLQFLVILMAFAELVGIASIAPFMAIIGDMTLLQSPGVYSKLYHISGVDKPIDFLFYLGLGVLLTLAISTLISMFTIWRISIFGTKVGIEIADQLYAFYMQQHWLFHATGSSAQLTKQISVEAMRLTNGIIQPLMQLNARMVLVTFISITMLLYNPMVALTGLVIFAIAYLLLYRFVKKQLVHNGNVLSEASANRFRLMNEGFGGIKDLLLLNRQNDFIQRFQKTGLAYAKAQGTNSAISQVPRYFMELVTFGIMVVLVLFLLKWYSGNLSKVLPILAVYALAAFKLLPALQMMYASITQIKGNIAAFDAIQDDLKLSKHLENSQTVSQLNQIEFKDKISLENVIFTYPGKPTPAIKNLTMEIPVHSTIGIVGSSGSGKSTTIDLILGLLTAQQGKMLIDNVEINETNKRSWQNLIGFVPQSIFLSEGTIAENIAFGIQYDQIDVAKVEKAIDLAHLDELIKQLPEGINTKVGERGVQLSGGQRQRIGIARALYNDANVLIFDEATSALDGITEKIIMDAINDFSGNKTIIMIAHRLKTVQKCDVIYIMDHGKVVDQGTFDELLIKNVKFREMAQHA